jgi:sporulation protein YlmC with PRC-barrel domain
MACHPSWPQQCLIAAALALTLTAVPDSAPAQRPQQAPNEKATPPPDASLEGLPLYSSDGKEIGKVITMGLDEDNQTVLVAEVQRQLGLGPMAIAVPVDMFVRKGRRIELTITETEVAARLRQ